MNIFAKYKARGLRSFNQYLDLFQYGFFDKLRRKEYNRLDNSRQVYLDFTGGHLYSNSQIRKHQEFLKKNVLGNPHSINPTSKQATQLVERTRKYVLQFFKAHDYYCIFTSNASGALHIVGESYPFEEDGQFLLLADNHNSVNGIREYCRKKNGRVDYCPVDPYELRIDKDSLLNHLNNHKDKKNKLFAYPAQSNASGVKHSLGWIAYAKSRGWDVLLDAAAFVPSNRLDLSKVKPDFVSLSFYKIFGYPTGIGCLLVRKTAFSKLKKPSFAGGTVKFVMVRLKRHFLANAHERFENGTVNYLDIPAVEIGLRFIENIGMEKISKRVELLTTMLLDELISLKHSNGAPLIKIYGPKICESRGGTVALNFLDPHGTLYPYQTIETKAAARNISIRAGCFCNPGIDEINNSLTKDELLNYLKNGDGNTNKARGSVRISVGFITNHHDIRKFIDFASQFLDVMLPKRKTKNPMSVSSNLINASSN